MGALQNAIEEGFSHDRVDGLIHQAMLAKRHRGSNFGLGLSCSGVVNSVHYDDVFSFLETSKLLEELREDHKRNKHHFSRVIQDLFLDNKPRVTLVLHVDEKHNEKRKLQEETRLAKEQEKLTPQKTSMILKTAMELAEAQKAVQDVSVLPTLTRKDIQLMIVPEIRGDITEIGKNTAEVILAPTNQLIYTSLLVPLSLQDFSEDEQLLLPLYCDLLAELGAGTFDSEQLAIAKDLACSGFSCSLHISTTPSVNEVVTGVLVTFYALPDRHAEASKLLSMLLNEAKFDPSDSKVMTRAMALILSTSSAVINSVPSQGHSFAMKAAASRASNVIDQTVNKFEGLRQVCFLSDLRDKVTAEGDAAQEVLKATLSALKKIHDKVRTFRCQTWSVCEPSEKEKVTARLRSLVEGTFSSSLTAAKVGRNEVIDRGLSHAPSQTDYISSPGEVSFVGAAFPGVISTDPAAAPLQVGLKLLSNEMLHQRVREQGGAYGSGATAAPAGIFSSITGFYSYRDPSPSNTVKIMEEAASFLADANAYTSRQVDEALLGIFGVIDAPRTPSSYGNLWYLNHLDDKTRQTYRDRLLAVSKDAIREEVPDRLNSGPKHFVIVGDEAKAGAMGASWKKKKW